MPVRVSIDVENDLVHRELHGRVSAEELLESIEAVVNDPDFHPGMKSLNDLRGVIHTTDKEYVMKIAEAMMGHADKLASAKVAVVVSADVVFGMMRMLQSYISDSPLDVKVFKDLEEAKDWLAL